MTDIVKNAKPKYDTTLSGVTIFFNLLLLLFYPKLEHTYDRNVFTWPLIFWQHRLFMHRIMTRSQHWFLFLFVYLWKYAYPIHLNSVLDNDVIKEYRSKVLSASYMVAQFSQLTTVCLKKDDSLHQSLHLSENRRSSRNIPILSML